MAKSVFKGRVLVVGCGSVSQCMLPMLFEMIDLDPRKVTVLDFVDNRDRIADILARGVRYREGRITPENYPQLLSEHLGAGDLLIDLGWNTGTAEILQWCRDHGVFFVNTSVEVWDPYLDNERTDPRKYTLYPRQMELSRLIQKWGDNRGPSAIVDHGANPGLVSHFTKVALEGIARKIIAEKPKDVRVPDLQSSLNQKNFRRLAHLAGVKVIHISERDSQIAHVPKRVNEFVNTWSIEGLYEESLAPAEMGWGTHECTLPKGAYEHDDGPRNQICLSTVGMNSFARSWVPSGEIVGMIIRHGEAYGISDRLTVWEGDRPVYRPTVHYVYCPTDAAIASLHELRMRQYDLQTNLRIMNDEIVDGRDELGVLLMGHDFRSWWTGSRLTIHEARHLVPGQNATTVQVAVAVIAAVDWMIHNPNGGLRLPDDVDHEHIVKLSIPYLGDLVSEAVNWGPLDNLDKTFTTYGESLPKQDDEWQFATFQRGIR